MQGKYWKNTTKKPQERHELWIRNTQIVYMKSKPITTNQMTKLMTFFKIHFT